MWFFFWFFLKIVFTEKAFALNRPFVGYLFVAVQIWQPPSVLHNMEWGHH